MNRELQHYAAALGQVGMLSVAAHLSRMGMCPCLPLIDIGYDLMIDGGVRIQVKATQLVQKPRWEQGTYWFNLCRRGKTRNFSKDSDFVILYGETQNRFWIVPSVELDGRSTVVLSDSARWIELDLDSMKALQANGMTLKQIAAEVGVGLSTVQTRLAGKLDSKNGHGELARKMRQYENRWDLIESCVASVKQLVPILDTAAV